MARLVDWRCLCGYVEHDALADVDASRSCPECGLGMEQDWLPRTRRNAQWQQPTVVFVSNDPEKVKAGVATRYPARADAPTPSGYERVEIRSDAEMGRFERSHNVLHHNRWYDNNGRGFDDTIFGEKAVH